MRETIVIYHGGCRDGFCAAWVVNKYLSDLKKSEMSDDERTRLNAEFIPGYYGQEPPDVKDKDIIIVDFCYPIETMKKLCKDNAVTWIDHHKTAQPFVDYIKSIGNGIDEVCNGWVFSNDKSGAGLAWDYFFPNEPRPWLVDYVEDRDLWYNRLEASKEVNACISSLEFDFREWNKWSNEMVGLAKNQGHAILRKTEQYVREVCKNVYFTHFNSPIRKFTEAELDDIINNRDIGYEFENIPTVNICQVDCSEVLHELCKRYLDSPFSLYWFKRQDGLYQYGLRSIGDFDVSTVAKLFGGGGHKNAAGFQLVHLLDGLK